MRILRGTMSMAIAVLAITAGPSFGQAAYPPYEQGYNYGSDGDADDPNGRDGWPADHPDNPNPGVAGNGGNGINPAGNGGKGGKGANGSAGGQGGNSSPVGGCGGEGGQGGDNPNGSGGDGGKGGVGFDCGGDGGKGGKGSTFGGNGGCGGNSSGGGLGGNGGKGGKVTSPGGMGGTGGCGGGSVGLGGCGGRSGDGGDYVPGSVPGLPGAPGYGMGNGTPPPCTGGIGDVGVLVAAGVFNGGNMPRPVKYTTGLELLASNRQQDLAALVPFIDSWLSIAGPEISIATWNVANPVLADGSFEHKLVLHPDSLLADRVRITIEYRETGSDPMVFVGFTADGSTLPKVSTPIDLGNGWLSVSFTAVREGVSEPFGSHLDLVLYQTRDVEVRLFDVYDYGQLGDVNFDGVIDHVDLQIVTANMYATGELTVEQGDTDLSGAVDANDLTTVIQSLD